MQGRRPGKARELKASSVNEYLSILSAMFNLAVKWGHVLRHTFGMALAAAGVDLDTIRRLMGHTDIKMTMRYLHAAPNRMQGAVQNLPFGKPIAQNLDSRAEVKG